MFNNRKKVLSDRKTVFIRLIKHLKGYYIQIVLSLLAAFSATAIQLLLPIMTGRAVDLILSEGVTDIPRFRALLLNMLILIAVSSVCTWMMNRLNLNITYRLVEGLRNALFENMSRLPFSVLDSKKDGDLLQRLTVDIDQLADGMIMSLNQLFTGMISIAITLVFMFRINVWIALAVVMLTPLSLFTASFISKKSFRLFRKQAEDKAALAGLTDELISELRTVKTFSYEKKALERFERLNNELSKSYTSSVYISSITHPITRFINALIYAVVAATGAVIVIGGGLTVGGLTSFLSYASQYSKPFNEISSVMAEMQNSLASAQRIFELMDEKPEEDTPEPAGLPAEIRGEVELQNISFSYSEDRPLIENMSLKVGAGQRVAIVGPTGSGKSTLINLLMRFYDPVKGRIYLDGVPSDSLKRSDLRSCFAMVLQDTWLKNASIYENIAFGNPKADRESVIRAAKEAHAHSFIRRLKHGYDELITDSGSSLSQGERQLICIARAMLKNAPVLLLDEATSSIDTRTEQKVQRAFLKLMEGRTTFVVAHRLSTIVDSDIILVMDNGNIVEAGSHGELMEKKAYYYRLYSSQFDDGGEETDVSKKAE